MQSEHLQNEFKDDLSKVTALAWCFSPYHIVRFAIEQNLFVNIEDNDLTIEQVAQKQGWKLRPTQALLGILEALDLIQNGELIKNTEISKKWLLQNSEYYFGNFFVRNIKLLESYEHLNRLFSEDTPNAEMQEYTHSAFGLSGIATQEIKEFGQPMFAASKEIFEELMKNISIQSAGSILDIGGGLGAFEKVLAEKKYSGNVYVLETQNVAKVAAQKLKGLNLKISFIEENWHFWNPKEQYELVLLGHVLHEEKKEDSHKLFQKAVNATTRGGTLIVVGFDENNLLGKIFRMNLLLEMGSDLPTMEWIQKTAKDFELNEKNIIKLPGGRVAWVGEK